MKITPEEIASVEEAGILHGYPIKLLRTIGGFWMAVGRPKGHNKDSVLAGGSHPAIVKHNISKQYPDFQPAMMKSEALEPESTVDKHSHFLGDELRNAGYDIYSVQTGSDIDFVVTKYNIQMALAKSQLEDGSVTITSLDIPHQFANALAGAVVEKAAHCKAQKLKIRK